MNLRTVRNGQAIFNILKILFRRHPTEYETLSNSETLLKSHTLVTVSRNIIDDQ